MALEIKHVADLLGMRFRIPSYQRGYRWERKQVEQLLDDLLEFDEIVKAAKDKDEDNKDWNADHPNEIQRMTNNESQTGFYCLQPLAVTKMEDGSYDVIDGQQRLTTIYLILCFLSAHFVSPLTPGKKLEDELYKLSYQTRPIYFFENKEFTSLEKSTSNIDFYFMSKAYDTISEWFNNHKNADKKILNLLLPSDFVDENEKRRARLHDVRFIWYNTPSSSSISTFNNLNYGKIGLTAAELVKALLFQCDIYDIESRDIAKKDAFARSTKWSLMEEDLQNSFFWGMLTASSIDKDLHIEMILDFVAENIDNQLGYSKIEGWSREDNDWVFNVFSKAISDNGFKMPCHDAPLKTVVDRIEYLWEEIQKVYAVFRNWFTNRELYHRIGLLVLLKTTYGRKKQNEVIRSLYDQYRKGTKPEFNQCLIDEIGDSVRIKAKSEDEITTEDGKVEKRLKRLNEIQYDEDPDDIRRVLLLFNVEVTIKRSKDEMLFPFHEAYKLNSLEHIHPQHLDEGNIDFETFKQWFETRKTILESRKSSNPDLQDAIKRLTLNLGTKETFEVEKQQCYQDLDIVDSEFDELAGMKPDIMHTLYNMALVDQPTNSALGNRLMDDKKRILKERQENSENGSYIPIGTWYAFNKYYSDTIKDMKFWSDSDRKAYYSAIESVYNTYVK